MIVSSGYFTHVSIGLMMVKYEIGGSGFVVKTFIFWVSGVTSSPHYF